MVLFVLLICLLIVDITLHLYSRNKSDYDLLGDITKLFLIPLTYLPVIQGLEKVFKFPIRYKWVIYALIFFYTLGDLLMILKKKKKEFLILGAISFSVGHILLVYYFVSFSFSYKLFILSLIVYGIEYYYFLRRIKSEGKDPLFTYVIYGFFVFLLSVGLTSSYSNNLLAWIFQTLGVILFGISDSKIAYKRANVERTSEFFIMSTYIAANLSFALAFWFVNAPYQMFIQ